MVTTEGINPLTGNVDLLSPLDRVKALHKVDMEMYRGFTDEKREDIVSLAEKFREHLYINNKIVLHGAGTSGRFAVNLANEYNNLLFNDTFHGIIAGGYQALLKSVEGAEDNLQQGAENFKNSIGNSQKVLYVSISCSGGAKCNLGALEEALKYPNVERVSLMFNDVENLSTHRIPELGKSVREIYEGFTEKDLIVNPILGPEAIAGSTRMKGGTATQIILDSALTLATMFDKERKESRSTLDSMLESYEQNVASLGEVSHQISKIADLATESLLNGGHVYYVGTFRSKILDDGYPDLTSPGYGWLGILDASECSPTFGAKFEDVRGFIEGGWSKLLSLSQISNLTSIDEKFIEDYRIDLKYFKQLPLNYNDLVIFLGEGKLHQHIFDLYWQAGKPAKVAEIILNAERKWDSGGIYPQIDESNLYCSVGNKKNIMKLILNTISTAAYVGCGKTHGNRMIDLRLGNDKLIARALKTVEDITGKDKVSIKHYFDEVLKRSGKESYAAVDNFVPLVMLSMAGLEYDSAKAELEKEPLIRKIIDRHYKK